MITLRSRETISSRRFFFFLFFFFFFFFFFFLLLFFTPCIATSVLSFTFNGGKRGDFPPVSQGEGKFFTRSRGEICVTLERSVDEIR